MVDVTQQHGGVADGKTFGKIPKASTPSTRFGQFDDLPQRNGAPGDKRVPDFGNDTTFGPISSPADAC